MSGGRWEACKPSIRINWNQLLAEAPSTQCSAPDEARHLKPWFLTSLVSDWDEDWMRTIWFRVEQRKHCPSKPNITNCSQWHQRLSLNSTPDHLLQKHNYQGTQETFWRTQSVKSYGLRRETETDTHILAVSNPDSAAACLDKFLGRISRLGLYSHPEGQGPVCAKFCSSACSLL